MYHSPFTSRSQQIPLSSPLNPLFPQQFRAGRRNQDYQRARHSAGLGPQYYSSAGTPMMEQTYHRPRYSGMSGPPLGMRAPGGMGGPRFGYLPGRRPLGFGSGPGPIGGPLGRAGSRMSDMSFSDDEFWDEEEWADEWDRAFEDGGMRGRCGRLPPLFGGRRGGGLGGGLGSGLGGLESGSESEWDDDSMWNWEDSEDGRGLGGGRLGGRMPGRGFERERERMRRAGLRPDGKPIW
ncbi:hypothetical protein K490DRAFT_63814 [Saccharata proteae CBS 121410]|uniref:Uncharacterized protein n=1 Tax=Saccharata proteae CBS 121410 TaxID=1314787 RepID=A0A6A5YFI7_9PEZI|nr:hypothetical protein K490DRAFT_63814 [Saccharata proteae CBS 121410]